MFLRLNEWPVALIGPMGSYNRKETFGMPDTAAPDRVRFTLELDRELNDRLDKRREQMRADLGFQTLSRNDFFARLGKLFLETRRDQRGRPVGTST